MSKPFLKLLDYTDYAFGCDDSVAFGKYIGLTWLDVVAIDPNYVVWCVGKTDYKFQYDLIVAAVKADYALKKQKRISRNTHILDQINPDWLEDVPF